MCRRLSRSCIHTYIKEWTRWKCFKMKRVGKFCKRQTWFFYIVTQHNIYFKFTREQKKFFLPFCAYTEGKDKSGIKKEKRKKKQKKYSTNIRAEANRKMEQPRKQEILIKDKHMPNKAMFVCSFKVKTFYIQSISNGWSASICIYVVCFFILRNKLGKPKKGAKKSFKYRTH